MIAPLSQADIDIFLVLHPGYYRTDGQTALLNSVRDALRVTYPRTPRISRNGQAVSINFTDFTVDVVPAFNRQGGGYLIANSATRRWIETDPKVHETFMAAANFGHAGKLVPLIKMFKAWNRRSGAYLHSFYLELMVETILRNVTISDSPTGVTYVFNHARERVNQMMIDPAGLGAGQVAGIARGSVGGAVQALNLAYNHALNALRSGQLGLARDGLGHWRKIFGDPFPMP